MKAKAKLLTAILAFCLVLSFLVTGVLATKKASVNLGGTVTFVAKNIYCEVTGAYTGTTPSQAPQKLFWDAENEPTDFSSWNGTSLEFDDVGTAIVFTVTIKNLSDEVGINISLTLGESDNIAGSEFGRTITYSDKDETNASYDPTASTTKLIETGDTATWTITYTVPSDEVSISQTNYAYIFSMASDKN